MSQLFVRKSIARLMQEGDPSHAPTTGALKRSLTAWNLVFLGIGAIIGAGIFTLTGVAAAKYAGPGIVFSFCVGGVLCALAGLCYAEMASMVPVAGSAYAYSYATMGELIAWIIGWDLVLEYAFGAVTVAAGWSGYFVSLLHKTLGIEFSDTVLQFTKGPWELVTLANGTQVHGLWNVPASFISFVVAYILYRGIKESAVVNNLIVIVKVVIVLAFIFLGWSVIDTHNWLGNPDATNALSAFVPPRQMVTFEGNPMESFGWMGVLTGAGVVFFSYIGFDAISTTAQEAKNPQRDLPIGILGSLIGCTILYILMALVMTGVVHYTHLNVPDPVAVGIDRIVELRGWGDGARKLFTFLVKIGAIAGLSSVILVMMLGQTRVFFAMAKDGLLPWFDRVHPKFQTPSTATWVTGLFVMFCSGCMPMSLVGELVSIGTLLAFVLVCLSVPIMRRTHPDLKRPFKVPFHLPVSILGALACLWVMWGLPNDTWIRLIVWLIIGFFIYAFYGRKHSLVRKENAK